MKKIFSIFIILVLCLPAQAWSNREIYENLEPITFSYEFNEDPLELDDHQKYFKSPYALARITCPLKFKNTKVPVGHYLLKPSEDMGRSFVMFKQEGRIKALVPVFNVRKINPRKTYPTRPKPKIPWYKKPFHWLFAPIRKRREAPKMPQSFIKSTILDRDFFQMELFYEDQAYDMIFMFDN